MTTPFENKEGWVMAATLHRGTVYMSEWETEAKVNEKRHRSPRQQEMCYWGYRFEAYATGSMVRVRW
jgi:RAT1-interacting protein